MFIKSSKFNFFGFPGVQGSAKAIGDSFSISLSEMLVVSEIL